MIEHSSKHYALALMSMLVATTLLTSHPAYSATSTGIMIPLYTYPGSTWDTVIAAKNAHPSVPIVAIINPDNGPGGAKDSNYASGIQNLRAAGVKVIGYVYTQYGGRSASSINADVDTYKAWYPQLEGIFYDEMNNSPGDETYYRNLSNYAKSVGLSFTVGNPGTDTSSSYVGTMDNLIIYETGGLPSLSFLGGWHTGYDKSNFSLLAYGVGSLNTSFVTSATNYVSYMYITNDNLDNPWDSVTPYFMDLAAALDTGILPPPPTNTVQLTVQSTDSSGASIEGLWTEISTGGSVVNSGYTTLSYSAISGTQYSVCVSDYGNYVFNHWSDGTTNSCKTVTPTQATTLIAIYQTGTAPPPPPTTYNISVQSVDLSGASISGLWTEISSGGALVNSGYTPLTYIATSGAQYSICVSNYASYVFDHWSDGSTNSCKTVTVTQDTPLKAFYKTSAPTPTTVSLKVRSLALDGSTITGLWTEISSGTKIVKSGYTTLTYSATSGTQYKVCMSNYQNFVFDHWGNGSTNNCKTVTPTQATTLTAYYTR